MAGNILLSACGRQPEQPDKTPVIALPEPTLTKIPTIEPTPTKEVVGISGTTITEEYLKSAFAGVGLGVRVGDGQAETTLVEFGPDYVSESWGKRVEYPQQSEEPIASLKYIVALGAYRGEEGFFAPGVEDGEAISPQLAELFLARLTLENVPLEAEQSASEHRGWIAPRNFILRPGTRMTVVGLLSIKSPAENTTESVPGGEPSSVLVVFTDYIRASEESGVPRHYLALLPTHFPADPDNRDALSLENLLIANGYHLDSRNKQIILDQGHKETRLGINQIEGETLIAEIRKEVGMVFVDHMNGEMIKYPIVPYFEEMPPVWDLEETVDEEGRTSFVLKSQDQKTGDFRNRAQVRYNQDQGEWKWSSVFAPALIETIIRDGEEFQVVEVNGQQTEVLKAEGLTLKWNSKTERFEYFDVDGQKVAHWILPEGEGRGRLEVTPLVDQRGRRSLDFEKHRGLFSSLSAEEGNEIFYRYWNQNQEIMIPIPFDIRQGGVIEEKKPRDSVLCFRGLAENTTVFSPIVAEAGIGGYGLDRGSAIFWIFKNEDFLHFTFPPQGEFLFLGGNVSAGDPVINLAGDYFPAHFAQGFYRGNQFFVSDSRTGMGLDFSNLVRDRLGRVTYLSGQ